MHILDLYSDSLDELRKHVLLVGTIDFVISVGLSVTFCCAAPQTREQTYSTNRSRNLEAGEQPARESASDVVREIIACTLNIVGALCTLVLLVGALKLSPLTCKIWIGTSLVLCVISIIFNLSQLCGPKCSCGLFLFNVAGYVFNTYMLLLVIKFVQVLEKPNDNNTQ